MTTSFDHPLNKDFCRFCGQCVDMCPTGALVNKQLKGTRSWDRTEGAHHLPVLRRGLQLRPERRTTARSSASRPTTTPRSTPGSLCVKGRFHTDLIDSPDRITTPLIKRDGVFEEASWDEALDLVAERSCSRSRTREGPDALAVLSSARCTNEENYLLQRLTRAGLNTNSIDHCART